MSFRVENNLKTKAFIMTKSETDKNLPRKYFKGMATEYMTEIGVDISNLETPAEIVREIRRYDFYGYSSLLIFIEDMENHILTYVCRAIANNPTLKYVTKLIVFYVFQQRSPESLDQTCLFTKMNQQSLSSSANFEYETTKDVFATRTDIENLTFIYSTRDIGLFIYDSLLGNFFKNLTGFAKQSSVQEIVLKTYGRMLLDKSKVFYHYSSNGGCYLYNVNPALAIIINHESFCHEQEMSFRDGSLQDVKALQKAFNSKKITSLTLNDGCREDVEEVMLKVRTTNFDGIKNLFIVIMSHGDEGDIIYAKTGSYSIRDAIVTPILENPTLKQVQKFVIVNACRGAKDPRLDSKEEVEKARNSLVDRTSLYPCDEKLMVIFSTQKGFVSLLFDEGAIFVQLFCDLFLENFDEISMEKIGEELEELMMENIADDQIPDFGSTDGQTHSIRMEFVNFFNNNQLLNDLANFFKKHLNDDLKRILDGKSILREEQDRALLGFGYVDGVHGQRLTDEQKNIIEKFIDTKQAKILKTNEIQSSLEVSYEWSLDWSTGRNRVRVLRKSGINS